jgi:hypothetical protein
MGSPVCTGTDVGFCCALGLVGQAFSVRAATSWLFCAADCAICCDVWEMVTAVRPACINCPVTMPAIINSKRPSIRLGLNF